MSELVTLVPVLRRPQRVPPFLDALESATPGTRVLFLADGDDQEELEAILSQPHRDLVIDIDTAGGSYAEKINRGVRVTSEPWIFLAADDLEPLPGWYEAARWMQADVVGLNDMIPRRRRRSEHATHFLLSRAYAEEPTIDGGEGPCHTGYAHEKVDDELIATARARGAYVYCADAQVRHLHPDVSLGEWDATYEKGRATREADRALFFERRQLWA